MSYSATFETNLIDAVTAAIMAPIAIIRAVLWLLWQGCKLCAPYRKYIGLAVALAAAAALFVAIPALLYGVGLTTVFALVTYPACKAVGA